MTLKESFKDCFTASKLALVMMCLVAILIGFSIHHTHHWLVRSVPMYPNGVGLMDWFYFGTSIYATWLSAACFQSATFKSDRMFFGLLVSLCLVDLFRRLAIVASIRSVVLSINQRHPEVLYSVGIIRWIIGLVMYAIVLSHWIFLRRTHPVEVQQ
jgi:hypothetical protein